MNAVRCEALLGGKGDGGAAPCAAPARDWSWLGATLVAILFATLYTLERLRTYVLRTRLRRQLQLPVRWGAVGAGKGCGAGWDRAIAAGGGAWAGKRLALDAPSGMRRRSRPSRASTAASSSDVTRVPVTVAIGSEEDGSAADRPTSGASPDSEATREVDVAEPATSTTAHVHERKPSPSRMSEEPPSQPERPLWEALERERARRRIAERRSGRLYEEWLQYLAELSGSDLARELAMERLQYGRARSGSAAAAAAAGSTTSETASTREGGDGSPEAASEMSLLRDVDAIRQRQATRARKRFSGRARAAPEDAASTAPISAEPHPPEVDSPSRVGLGRGIAVQEGDGTHTPVRWSGMSSSSSLSSGTPSPTRDPLNTSLSTGRASADRWRTGAASVALAWDRLYHGSADLSGVYPRQWEECTASQTSTGKRAYP
ncbi:hypothetical protein CDCA_CDCA13G3688 [Cyanidium caldarium]|uniref:Uncharacterized protein n=1 Tax=Cyanidium caldarium TaxID=2771 RepID=A0AAV9J0V7_CYACA|nr:hypothetical protein CDCA_CDCA13G3688 [Cyanidium caldarium]